MVSKQTSFKDYFSIEPDAYRQYRPGYPQALFSYLAKIVPARQCAWDCATGSGQSAVPLSGFFEQVIATDASESQIISAVPVPGVTFRVASAEHSLIAPSSVDLITVAQALHWFDLQAFTEEVERVLKPGGVLAVWTYNLLQIDTDIDTVVRSLYYDVLGPYWPPERKWVEQGYVGVSFPFERIDIPKFSLSADWALPQLFGYLQTWSALKQYQKIRSHNPLEDMAHKLVKAWGEPAETRQINWPLSLSVWKKTA